MPPLSYANYRDLEKLLTIQKPRSTLAEHDESVRRSDAGAGTGALPIR
jgi:tryptophan 2,3-dioxygenase